MYTLIKFQKINTKRPPLQGATADRQRDMLKLASLAATEAKKGREASDELI